VAAGIRCSSPALGFSDELWLGLPLPWDMTPLGMPPLHAADGALGREVLVRTATIANWNEPLPNDAALLGLGLFAQAFALVAGANPAGALATRALEVVVGTP
jgi:hypothetical protein